MQTYSELTPTERLSVAKQALHNALNNDDLAERLAKRSYTAEKIQIGVGFQSTAQYSFEAQIREYGDAIAATEEFDAKRHELRETAKEMRSIARIAYKDKPELQQLFGLNRKLKKSWNGWITQTESMINNAFQKPELIETLAPYGYPEEEFTRIKEELTALPQLKSNRESESAEAQQATRDRDEAIDTLDEWMQDFFTIAKIAVKDKPELMELLGRVVPS